MESNPSVDGLLYSILAISNAVKTIHTLRKRDIYIL